MTWHQDAACKTVPTRIFYPEKGLTAQHAKSVCERCPVQAECAAEGAHEPHGIWGGKSPLQRGTGLHNRGEKHRLYDVAACSQCDTRWWTHKTNSRSMLCPTCRTCRTDDEAVA